MTLRDRLAAARERLIAAGVSPAEAAIDVDLYARVILGWDRSALLVRQPEPVPATLEPTFSEWIARREQHEPSAYIVGVREFWGLDFRVTPDVLIPRPETEFVVEEALALLRDAAAPARCLVADVGTGSGCIAVSIAHDLPRCDMVATDVSDVALAVASHNARRHGVAARVRLVQTSYLDGIGGTFDLITANPPYVRETDKPALARDVRHEPDVALFGGADGLRDLDGVLASSITHLRPGGWLVMEFGFGQEDAVRDLVRARPQLHVARVRADLQGLARTAIIQRQ